MLNLDTHILLYALAGELTSREKSLLSSQRWSVSAIVLWEIVKLVQLERIEIDIDSGDFGRFMAPVHVWPVTYEICACIRNLDFKSDPADELISATSIVHQVPLLTRDRKIRKSSVIPLA
jgi:PIN domain nuclease of toxin-antitoxin system